MSHIHIKTFYDIELTKLTNESGAFYAFSDRQYNALKQDGVTYTQLPDGLIINKDLAVSFHEARSNLFREATKKYLEVNSKESIILYELCNHECFYCRDGLETVFEIVKAYNFTEDEVREVWRSNYDKMTQDI